MSQREADNQILAGNRVIMQVKIDDETTLQASMEVTEDDLYRWRSQSGVSLNIGSRLLEMIREDYRSRLINAIPNDDG